MPSIAESSLHAALTGLGRIPHDPGFCTVLTNVFKFVESARSIDFIAELQNRGFSVPQDANLLDLASWLRTKIDRELTASHSKSDTGELAQKAFIETLLSRSSTGQPSLFQIMTNDVQIRLRRDDIGNR